MSPEQVAAAVLAAEQAARRFAGRARKRGVPVEDLVQTALVEIVRAAPNWQPTGPFGGFCYRVAERRIRDALNELSSVVRQNPRCYVDHLEIPYGEPGEHEGIETFCSVVSPDESEPLSRRSAAVRAELVRARGPRAAEVLAIFEDETYEAAGERLGITRQAVYGQVRTLRETLRHSDVLRALWEEL